MKLKRSDKRYRGVAPYLFEEDNAGHEIVVERDGSSGGVSLYWKFASYVPAVMRDQRARLGWSNPDRTYEWRGRGVYITPKQARKLAKALLKAADSGE